MFELKVQSTSVISCFAIKKGRGGRGKRERRGRREIKEEEGEGSGGRGDSEGREGRDRGRIQAVAVGSVVVAWMYKVEPQIAVVPEKEVFETYMAIGASIASA